MPAKKPLKAPPKGLKTAGKALWRAILGDLGDGWELDARELEFLTRACSAADHLAALEKAVDADGVMVKGSRNQVTVNPAISEIRQTKLTQLRLLSAIEMTDPLVAARAATPASARGRKAAQTRWQNHPKRSTN